MNRFFKYKLEYVFFWVFTVFFHAYTRIWLLEKGGAGQFVLEIIVRNALLAIVIYVTLLGLIPYAKKTANYFFSLLFLVLLLSLYVLVKNAHDVYLYSYVLEEERGGYFATTFYNFSIVIFYLAFSVALYLSREWYLQQALIRKIEVEKLNTELDYLKAQINPHFLFNSLNTVFFQIDKSNTLARDTLMKFSDMLRFQLYECNGNEIALEKEIGYLQNYVDLQRLRKNENYDIQFEVVGDLHNFTVAPLLLIPFIENAFKHVSAYVDRTNRINIRVERKEATITVKVQNTKDDSQKTPSESYGIGLKNVQRRLALQYMNMHTLTIADKDGVFEVELKIVKHEN